MITVGGSANSGWFYLCTGGPGLHKKEIWTSNEDQTSNPVSHIPMNSHFRFLLNFFCGELWLKMPKRILLSLKLLLGKISYNILEPQIRGKNVFRFVFLKLTIKFRVSCFVCLINFLQLTQSFLCGCKAFQNFHSLVIFFNSCVSGQPDWFHN